MNSERIKVTAEYDEEEDEDEDEDDEDDSAPVKEFILNEFISYKSISLNQSIDNFVTPNEYKQELDLSAHSLFGRDRVFDYPVDFFTRIHAENLAHLHFDSKNAWLGTTPQWFCTSNESIVYSAFKVTPEHYHFIIHDLLMNTDNNPDYNAHEFYKRSDIEYYLSNAEHLRFNYLKK